MVDGRPLEDTAAVITGATSGIGRAIAEALARAGASIVMSYRASSPAAHEVTDAIAQRGGRAVAVRADLSKRSGCERLVREAFDRLGRVDTWVNNAGADVLTGEAARWDWERKLDLLLAVDVKGTIACCRAAAEAMARQSGGGNIINLSWDHVTTGMLGENPELFSATKGAVLAYSKSLARSVAPRVRVNTVSPGWIETRFGQAVDRTFHRSVAASIPMARWGTPQDVAATVLYLASPAASFITGQAVNVNGGEVM